MLGLGVGIPKGGLVSDENNTTNNTQALHFDGAGDELIIADNNDLSFSGASSGDDVPFSIALWAKRDSTSTLDAILAKAVAVDTELEYRAYFHTTLGLTFDINDVSSGYRRVYVANTSTDWQHLVFTYSGTPGGASEMKIYVDGVSQTLSTSGSDNDGMTPGDGDLRLGTIYWAATTYDFGGEMCQFMIWKNHELTLAEAQYLYASRISHRNPLLSATGYSTAAANAVVLWLPLDSDLNDDSGNSYNGTAVDGAALSSNEVPVPE